MSRKTNDRYIIKYGKFGAYFYDIDNNEDMTLERVCNMLNHLERVRSRKSLKKEEGKDHEL